MIRVTVWNEYLHDDPTFEHCSEEAIKQHPNGLHETIADIVRELGDEVEVRTAQMKQPENGLTDEVLENTDVMIWWGHMGHQFVADEVVEKVYKRIMNGMGLIVLHSGHYSKIFRKLNGTTCSLKWRDGTYERLFNVKPTHPIADGIPEHFELGIEECYGEYFDIATPDDVILRAGMTSAKSSAAAAPSPADTARSSISSRATRQTVPSTIRTSAASSRTPCVGAIMIRTGASPSAHRASKSRSSRLALKATPANTSRCGTNSLFQNRIILPFRSPRLCVCSAVGCFSFISCPENPHSA